MMVINGARRPDKNENCGGCVSSNDSFSLGTDGNIIDALLLIVHGSSIGVVCFISFI